MSLIKGGGWVEGTLIFLGIPLQNFPEPCLHNLRDVKVIPSSSPVDWHPLLESIDEKGRQYARLQVSATYAWVGCGGRGGKFAAEQVQFLGQWLCKMLSIWRS
eukprot:scaffold57590_cov18-Tisochrysis_lutea.AAC.1